MLDYVIGFEALRMGDVARVGGKNASLGEMTHGLSRAGVRVPAGFATSADAFREFLSQGGLADRIHARLAALDVDDVAALAATGADIRRWIVETPLPTALEAAIATAYRGLEKSAGPAPAVAVRSSATAEDLPEASFAGQQETYLNVRDLDPVLSAVRHVFASLYNDRAIAYRVHQGFDHRQVALSAGVQHMVRSDLGASGVLFTLDTESGFRDVVFITAAYGLGETVVQGAVNPDEFYVHKPTLAAGRPAILRRRLGQKALKMIYAEDGHGTRTLDVPMAERLRFCLSDAEVEELARQAVTIERHYDCPLDIEWARDGSDGRLYILQARPETVKSRSDARTVERFELKHRGQVLASGRAIGQRIGVGRTRVILKAADMAQVRRGDVLVTDMTDPDWEPIMKRAAAIVTNRGGRTCHAAIVARELGIPAVVGCGDATHTVPDGQEVTVSCAEGDNGFVYRDKLEYSVQLTAVGTMPALPVQIMMNVGSPDRAFEFAAIPNAGVGLARIEFIINNMIGVHPKALLEFDAQTPEIKDAIRAKMAGYAGPVEFYVDKLAEGISTIAAAFHPKPVVVRLSDFKSNEYAKLLAGERYEPHEENPMLGFRGAGRYLSDAFRPCFELECRALKKVRDTMGLTNVEIMIPFARTVAEAEGVLRLMAENGLKRGENELRVIMMCEIPSNALLAEQFLRHFDGFSIGSNDLTQLTLGLDRDSALVAGAFDERDAAVKVLLRMAIQACHKQEKYVGICGQGPSDHPDLAQWLLDEGIDSMSLNPDSVIATWQALAARAVDGSSGK
jgi:pyruvate,water dikinase